MIVSVFFREKGASDRKSVCFSFNNNSGKCLRKNCTFPHVCSKCYGNHHKRVCPMSPDGPKTHQPLSNLGTCQGNQKKHNAIVNKYIVTPINVKALHHWLQGYDNEKLNYLVKGFTFGFRIPYMGQRRYRYSKNIKPANDKLNILKQKIEVEVVSGRVGGPFTVDNLPFGNLQISPLGLEPKQKPGEYRVIHHLSYPDGLSINDDIAKEDSAVSYQTIDDAVTLIKQFGKGALLSKTDIEHGYKKYTYAFC